MSSRKSWNRSSTLNLPPQWPWLGGYFINYSLISNLSDAGQVICLLNSGFFPPIAKRKKKKKISSFVKTTMKFTCCLFSHVWLFVTPQTVACQTPLSTGFPRQEYWSGLPFPSLGDLPNPGIKPTSPALASRFFAAEPTWNPKLTWLLWKLNEQMNVMLKRMISIYLKIYYVLFLKFY